MSYLCILQTSFIKYKFGGNGKRGFVKIKDFNSAYPMNPLDVFLRVRRLDASSALKRMGLRLDSQNLRDYRSTLAAKGMARLPVFASADTLAVTMRKACEWLEGLIETYPKLHLMVYNLNYDYGQWLSAWSWAMDRMKVCSEVEPSASVSEWYDQLMASWLAETVPEIVPEELEEPAEPVQQELPLELPSEETVEEAAEGPETAADAAVCQRIPEELDWLNGQRLPVTPEMVRGVLKFRLVYRLQFKADQRDLETVLNLLNLSSHPLIDSVSVGEGPGVILTLYGSAPYPGTQVDSFILKDANPAVDQIVEDITTLLASVADMRQRYARTALVETTEE